MHVETTAMDRIATSRYRITAAQYHRMAEAGIIPEDVRVELLDGEIVETTPIGPRHAECVDRLDDLFTALRGPARPRVRNPLALGVNDEPVPDFMLVLRREGGYPDSHPRPGEVSLVVEVYDTTDRADRERKSRRYAEGGVREYWVVDLLKY